MRTGLSTILFAVACCSRMVYAAAGDREAMYYANAYADHYGVPRPLVYAIISQESGWNQTAISNRGALGLMQLMPGTARRYGVRRPFAKSDNIGGGVRYLGDLLTQFHGDMRLAVAAYYTGEDRIHRRGLAFQNRAVVAYVEQVRWLYQRELKIHMSSTPEEQQ
jgi:soluble lytic murein transglycosylase-like protein